MEALYEPIDKPFCIDIKQNDEPICIIGDVHACNDELADLISLCWKTYGSKIKFIFVGDLIDRGPENSLTVTTAQIATGQHTKKATQGHIIIGNHDRKLLRYCLGKQIQIHKEQEWFKDLNDKMKDHYLNVYKESPTMIRCSLLSGQKLIIAHGAAPEIVYSPLNEFKEDKWFLRNKDASTCYYGHTTGKRTEEGYPERLHKPVPLQDYTAIFGHIVHDRDHYIAENEPGTTIYIDHGCCFGYWLSAAIFEPGAIKPHVVSIAAKKSYVEDDATRLVRIGM